MRRTIISGRVFLPRTRAIKADRAGSTGMSLTTYARPRLPTCRTNVSAMI
jgi:hypothetical protein